MRLECKVFAWLSIILSVLLFLIAALGSLGLSWLGLMIAVIAMGIGLWYVKDWI